MRMEERKGEQPPAETIDQIANPKRPAPRGTINKMIFNI
jgi:hypothetical protein